MRTIGTGCWPTFGRRALSHRTSPALADRHQRDPVPILRLLEREHLIVAVEPDRFYAAEAVDQLVTDLRDGMTEDREYNPPNFGRCSACHANTLSRSSNTVTGSGSRNAGRRVVYGLRRRRNCLLDSCVARSYVRESPFRETPIQEMVSESLFSQLRRNPT